MRPRATVPIVAAVVACCLQATPRIGAGPSLLQEAFSREYCLYPWGKTQARRKGGHSREVRSLPAPTARGIRRYRFNGDRVVVTTWRYHRRIGEIAYNRQPPGDSARGLEHLQRVGPARFAAIPNYVSNAHSQRPGLTLTRWFQRERFRSPSRTGAVAGPLLRGCPEDVLGGFEPVVNTAGGARARARSDQRANLRCS